MLNDKYANAGSPAVYAHQQGSTHTLLVLSSSFALQQATADAYTVPNAFGALLQQQGGVGLNATTSHDCTRYFVSLPSNKLELWFALEAERFQWPVFRWVQHAMWSREALQTYFFASEAL